MTQECAISQGAKVLKLHPILPYEIAHSCVTRETGCYKIRLGRNRKVEITELKTCTDSSRSNGLLDTQACFEDGRWWKRSQQQHDFITPSINGSLDNSNGGDLCRCSSPDRASPAILRVTIPPQLAFCSHPHTHAQIFSSLSRYSYCCPHDGLRERERRSF